MRLRPFRLNTLFCLVLAMKPAFPTNYYAFRRAPHPLCLRPLHPTSAAVCAMLIATTTYLSLSWGAYATFGVGVEGDLLEAYPRTGLLTAARISVSLLVMSCYPLQVRSMEGYLREPASPARRNDVDYVP